MCEDKEEARSEAAAAVTPKRLCWPKRTPAPIPDTRGLCCAKLLRKNGKAKKKLNKHPYKYSLYIASSE
ncbi:unnamed protein product [Euphydryas editha]|uniref:Uncharacterized protein n=1 Tax=Euphydryas editha TaxID=104508 RepID=A0AAU9U1C6_EUPED|nr:unnamed protein product [Euphydryas editha]